ncbi:antibiotic biosynthesis monooxygenase [Blastococcus jejuensis]|uniref:Antibiotic biosynthesis monooxygenase n=2 Tax=Blastococcus jejuensis TaxID=351224 RepID=A0ABP6PCW0_9ACTN
MAAGPSGKGNDMSIVKINAIVVPPDRQERFEERFRGRGGHVERTPGFEWFELLRPLEGTDQYLVYTRWSSEEAYRAWESSQDFARSHGGGGDDLAPAASDSHHLWSYAVIESTGPHAG